MTDNIRRDPYNYNPDVSEVIEHRIQLSEKKAALKCQKFESAKKVKNKEINDRRNRISDILERHNADRLELC